MFEKINKTDRLLSRMMKTVKKNHIAEIKNQIIDSTTDFTEIKRSLREFGEQWYANKLNKFPKREKY